MATGTVVKVSGPLVVAEGLADANMYDVVRVGPQRLIGEIIAAMQPPSRSTRKPPALAPALRWKPPASP